jgi:hypothetical protein
LTALMALTIAAGAASSAFAQAPCNLPDETVAARSPADVDGAAVRACVDGNAAMLRQEDYEAIRQARQNLLTPLRAANVSVFFRLAYSDTLRPVLTPMVKDLNEDRAINALRIAGELGTTDGARLCVEALKDNRASVRMMAASGLARTFAVLWATPTIQTQPFAGIETELAKALLAEKDPEVMDGLAMAYEAAVQIPNAIVPDARNIALLSASTKFGEIARRRNVSEGHNPALLRASKAMLDALTVAVSEPKPPAATLREIGGFGGDLLAYAMRELRKGDVSDVERQQLAVLVGQAQNLVSVAGSQLGMTPKAYRLNTLVAEGNDTQYFRDVMNVIGAEGDLVKTPFNHPKERFIPAP